MKINKDRCVQCTMCGYPEETQESLQEAVDNDICPVGAIEEL